MEQLKKAYYGKRTMTAPVANHNILVKQHCDLHRHFSSPESSFRTLENSRGRHHHHGGGELYFASGVLPAARPGRSARWRLGSPRQDPRPPRRPIAGEVRAGCSGGLGDLGVAFPARSYYHAEQKMPGHPAFPLDCGFLYRSLLKDAMRGAQPNLQSRKPLGARGMLVKVGVGV